MIRPRLGLAIAVLGFGSLTAVAPANVVTDPVSHKRFGIVPAAGSAAAQRRLPHAGASVRTTSCATDCSPLLYGPSVSQTGPVQHAEHEYLFFWGPSGSLPAAYKTGLAQWLNDLAGVANTDTTPVSVTQQYYDTSGPGGSQSFARFAVQNAGSIVDTTPYPSTGGCPVTSGYTACVTDAQIQNELTHYIASHGLPTGNDVEYFVLTPQGVDGCFDQTSGGQDCAYTGYCGYHSNFAPSPGAQQIVYADLPWVYGALGCGSGAPNLNSNQIDSVVDVLSHELSETITDPVAGTGWIDSSGNEIGDKCVGLYGNTQTAGNGAAYNTHLGGDFYLMQLEFSNQSGDCALANASTNPVGSISVSPTPVRNGSSATFTANVTDPAGVQSVLWDFGDQTTGTGTAATHTYDTSATTETVTATVIDGHGKQAVFTLNVTVVPVPASHSLPVMSGQAREGSSLGDSGGAWSNSPTSISYQWQDCDTGGASCSPLAGATRPTYRLGPGDVGHTVRVSEVAVNSAGASDPALSAPSAVVLPLPPSSQGVPVITGRPREGSTLTRVAGTWSGSVSGLGDTWQRCPASGVGCSAIPGATGQTYSLTRADVGHRIRLAEVASNAGGQASASSSATSAITPSPADVKAALTGLSTTRAQPRLIHLISSGRSVFYFAAPSAGQLVIVVTHGAVTVARGAHNFSAPQTAGVPVNLTAQGRKLLSRLASPATFQLVLTFTPTGAGATTVRRAFSLR